MAQFGEKVWFRKIGQDRCHFISKSHDSRNLSLLVITIEQEQFCAITKNGVVRGNSWTRQTLGDAWE